MTNNRTPGILAGRRLPLLALCACAAICAVVFGWYALRLKLNHDDLTHFASRSALREAEVLRFGGIPFEQEFGGRFIQFRYPTSEDRTVTSVALVRSNANYTPGQRIKVLYDTTDPTRADLVDEYQRGLREYAQLFTPAVALSIGSLLAFGIGWHALTKRRPRPS